MKMGRREFTKSLAAGAAVRPGESWDVAVIGAGVFGAWTAYRLRKAGKSVVLLDAYGPGNSRSSSGGESRIIRMGYGPDEIYTRSAMRSLILWQEFFQKTRQPLFHRTGVLWIAREGDAYAGSTRRTLEKCGVRFEILQADELARRYPQIRVESKMWAILEPDSGALMARRAVEAVVQESVRNGVAFLSEAVVAPAGKDRLSAIKTRTGPEIRAGIFVFACGPWLPKIFPDLLANRILPTRQEVLFFGPPAGDRRFAPPAFPVWIDFGDERGAYGFPDLENRGFKLAFDRHGPPFDPDSGQRVVTTEGIAGARKFLAERFPALQDAPLVESRVCQYENTANGDFLIDRHPGFSNVWLVGGGSGHGFKHGPAVGEYVEAHITGEAAIEPRFSLASKKLARKRTVY